MAFMSSINAEGMHLSLFKTRGRMTEANGDLLCFQRWIQIGFAAITKKKPMPEIINLNDRLGRLSQTVQHRIAKRNERFQSEYADKQARKAKDWQTVKDHHPDVAQFISDAGKVFGPLASVTVTDNAGDVLLDSRRYE